jgi:hypothetical protein
MGQGFRNIDKHRVNATAEHVQQRWTGPLAKWDIS